MPTSNLSARIALAAIMFAGIAWDMTDVGSPLAGMGTEAYEVK